MMVRTYLLPLCARRVNGSYKIHTDKFHWKSGKSKWLKAFSAFPWFCKLHSAHSCSDEKLAFWSLANNTASLDSCMFFLNCCVHCNHVPEWPLNPVTLEELRCIYVFYRLQSTDSTGLHFLWWISFAAHDSCEASWLCLCNTYDSSGAPVTALVSIVTWFLSHLCVRLFLCRHCFTILMKVC